MTTYYVLSGKTVSSKTISGGDELQVRAGGTAVATTVSSGGTEIIFSGGLASDTTVSGGGAEYVNSGGVAIGTTLVDGGYVVVSSGGVASATTISNGGAEYLYAGAAASGTTVGGGYEVIYSGGVARGATVSSGGTEYLYSGGTAIGATVGGGAYEVVDSGGLASATIVGPGGAEFVYSGGTAVGTIVGSGGDEVISSGGVASATTVGSGGAAFVYSGGTASDPTIAGGTLELAAGAIAAGTIDFASVAGGELRIDDTAMPGATIAGLAPGDSIDLAGVRYDSAGAATISGGALQVSAHGSIYNLALGPGQDFLGDFFHIAPDGGTGTLVIEDQNPCYCRGTLILTERGEVAVEALSIGDRVVTHTGRVRRIKWIGRRSYAGRFAMGQRQILPIRVAAGALAGGAPRRDLWVSPNHALYLEGVLIEVRDMVNGVSVVQVEAVDAIEYFHIELASHDVIVAEGALAESYVDCDNRQQFHNAPDYRARYPEAAGGPLRYCAPRRAEGVEVERARALLAVRAGLEAVAERADVGALRGRIDEVGRRISGWAQDERHPEVPVCLDILAGGELLGQVLANRYRADLAAAGLGSGRHGFAFVPAAGVDVVRRPIAVCRSRDGALLDPPVGVGTALRRATPGSLLLCET